MGALTGVRVIDFGQYIAGPLAAMMLCDQGAEVIRIDPPGGPRLETPANATWNRGKRSIVLDLKDDKDRDTARQLILSADVVIENFRPGVMQRLGLGPEEMTAANPSLIYASLPGFASDDPRSGVRAFEGVVESAAALYRVPKGAVFGAIPISSSYAAFLAADSVVAALFVRQRSGAGQRIEVPLFDASFTAIGYHAQRLHAQPDQVLRPPRSGVWALIGEHICKDGRWVYFHTGNKRVREFLESAGKAGWLDGDVSEEEIDALFRTRTAREWEDIGHQVGTEIAFARTSAEWIHEQHPKESGLIVEVDDPKLGPMLQPGLQVSLSRTPGAIRGPAPMLNADREAILAAIESRASAPALAASTDTLLAAYDGVKVLDLCIVLAGPTCGRTMAEFGANVIKITAPPRPSPNMPARPVTPIGDAFNIDVNRGKRSIVLDLKTPEGKEVFWKLAEDADVIVQNFRQGVIESLGLGYDEVRKRRPDIVYASLNTYGHAGPWAGRPGHEQLAQTATGMAVRYGGAPRPQLQANAPVNDYGTGLMGAFAVGLALYHKARTGEGQHVTTALVSTSGALQSLYLHDFKGKFWDEPKGQDALGFGPLQRLYKGRDDWFFLGAREEDLLQLASIDGLIGVAELQGEALSAFLEQRFAEDSCDAWVSRLTNAGLGAHRLAVLREVMADSWVREHGLSITREHTGIGLVETIGPAPRLSRTPIVPGCPAPRPGAQSREILEEHGLGACWQELLAKGVVEQAEAPGGG